MKIKGPVWALGAMSGTSLDGVDAALLRTDGERIFEFGDNGLPRLFGCRACSACAHALGHWPDDAGVEAAAEVVETAHAELLSRYRTG